MKEQPQQPMAPMAFYPTWQTATAAPATTDPSQTWQNQFIQQIPSQNGGTTASVATAIAPLNSLDFQPQGYAYPNGYVQTTGLQFDPNSPYSRTATTAYSSPAIQRYEFQAQQITPINQVSLQSVSFAPNVTAYSQIASPTVLLNHQQHHSHYAAHQQPSHLDQLNNKQMTMSLTTSSGNEMPGYPRVNSVPPRSLNCNGYPGLGEYGGNSINTTANNQSTTNTSTASSNQMQPPASSNTQSPSRQQPSRPNSSSNHLYQQQSPSHFNNNNNNNGIHMSPTSQAQSPSSHHHGGSTTPNNNQHYPTSGMITPTSHHQQMQDGSQDWNQNAWNGSQHGEMFNQSDRINLNTRLKTMILNKNDKDQQQQQQSTASTSSTGHFLSYSHQHLQSSTESAQQQQQQAQLSSDNLSNNSSNNNNLPLSSNNNNNNSIESKITDAGDDGGFKMNDSWKSSIIKQEQEHSSKQQQQQQDFFEHKQQLNEKNIGIDPGGGGGSSSNNSSRDIQEESSSKEPKAIDNYSSNNNGNNNDNNQHTYPSGGGSSSEEFSATLPKIEKISSHENNNEHEKHSYAYNSAHEYQQHQNMVNNIKKEIGDETTPNIKYDGYEKNYQNFIRYADFCDAQQPGQYQDHQKQQSQYQQDYIQHQSQGYSAYNYPYQNYPHHPSQNYPQPHAQNAYQPFMSQQAAYQQHGHHPHHSTSLTNFEQQIPLHTYPIPKHSSSAPTSISSSPSISSSKHGESIHPSATPPIIKTEQSNSLHPYPFLSENMAAAAAISSGINKDNVGIGQHYSSSRPINPINEVPIENSCNTTPTKEQSIKEEVTEEETTPVSEVKIVTTQRSTSSSTSSRSKKQAVRDMYNERNNKPEVPECDCFSSDKKPPEPGSYYTHLGCASTVAELRKEIEQRAGLTGKQLRIEKVLYTGKEGKSTQGCPTAKWVIRRVDPEEKALFIVKRRQGHRCRAAFIVISIVVWDAMPLIEADNMYKLLVHKLNKFGLPTTRRCATNENRTCACQGLDPETCGASYSFGCSWSMYYNGCKYARSKTVRKFRLSVKSEEAEIEERMNIIATILSPLYKTIAPKAYDNQVQYEVEAPDCRLGLKTGKPFSGVTCCVDFCAHTHRDLHNMQDGCTVQATLLKPRPYGMAPEDEQLHVLPLYTMDGTDEFDSEEGQKKKHETGAVQILEKFPTEVRVRSTPLQPCRRHGKKRGNEKDPEGSETPQISQPLTPVPVPQPIIQTPPPQPTISKDSKSKSRSRKSSTSRSQTPVNQTQLTPQTPTIPSQNNQGQSAFSTPTHPQQAANNQQQQQQPQQQQPQQQTQIPGNGSNTSTLLDMASMIDNFTDAQLQSNQISSTVLDSPYSYDYQTGQYIDNRQYHYQWQQDYNKLRGEEISPDTTTRPGSSNSSTNSSSAFSPNIQQQSQGLYESNNNSLTNGLIKDEYSKGQQYHQLETAFVKPKAPEYNPQGYGNYTPHQPVPQHPNNYIGYSAYPYDPYAYNSYSNYSSNYPSYNMGYGQPTAQSNWGLYPQTSPMGPTATPVIPAHFPPQSVLGPPTAMNPPPQKITEVIGEVTEVNDNVECFQDKQMGGVAVALPHGSVVIECAKLEMHSTTALKKPNRLNPNRISLIFYQHRNLNRPKHGTCEWAEKMRLKKLGITTPENDPDLRELLEEDDMKQEFMDEDEDLPPVMPAKPAKRSRSRKDKHPPHNSEDKIISSTFSPKTKAESNRGKSHQHNKANTLTTTSWTTLFPMHP
ncbi:hypothetical protein ACKWTF_003670 [Chironomus riparius]